MNLYCFGLVYCIQLLIGQLHISILSSCNLTWTPDFCGEGFSHWIIICQLVLQRPNFSHAQHWKDFVGGWKCFFRSRFWNKLSYCIILPSCMKASRSFMWHWKMKNNKNKGGGGVFISLQLLCDFIVWGGGEVELGSAEKGNRASYSKHKHLLLSMKNASLKRETRTRS